MTSISFPTKLEPGPDSIQIASCSFVLLLIYGFSDFMISMWDGITLEIILNHN